MAPPLSSDTDPTAAARPVRSENVSIGELIDYVKTYAKQETVGPLRGAGRWLAFGAAGAIALGLGLSLLLLGVLRLVQSEWEWTQSQGHSWLPYVIVLIATVLLLVLALTRIPKSFLHSDDK